MVRPVILAGRRKEWTRAVFLGQKKRPNDGVKPNRKSSVSRSIFEALFVAFVSSVLLKPKIQKPPKMHPIWGVSFGEIQIRGTWKMQDNTKAGQDKDG